MTPGSVLRCACQGVQVPGRDRDEGALECGL